MINSPNLTVCALLGSSSQGGCLTPGFHWIAKLILNLLSSFFWASPVLVWQAAHHASLPDWDYSGPGDIVLEGKQYHCVPVCTCVPCKGQVVGVLSSLTATLSQLWKDTVSFILPSPSHPTPPYHRIWLSLFGRRV